MTLTAAQEKDLLAYDPFAGDFGDQSDKTFEDAMHTAAKTYAPGACVICGNGIAKGERYRKQKAVIDGAFHTCRMCEKCCVAMALSWTDSGDAIDARTILHPKLRHVAGLDTEPDTGAMTTQEVDTALDKLEGIERKRTEAASRFRPAMIVAILAALAVVAYVMRAVVLHG